MQRRLFLAKTSLGLLVPLVPGVAFGRAKEALPGHKGLLWTDETHPQPAELVSQIGTIERVTITYAYNPEQISPDQLISQFEADAEQIALALHLPTRPTLGTLFASPITAQQESCGGEFSCGNLLITALAMAHEGMVAARPTRRCQWVGTLGVINTPYFPNCAASFST